MLRGGTISGNEQAPSRGGRGGGGDGVRSIGSGKITVAKAEEGKPQTISKDNKQHDWRSWGDGSEIIGIPHKKISAA